MAQLVLVKHAMPVIDETKMASEWMLSEVGREQSLRLAERLVAYDPQVMISSDEPKAQETAIIAAKRLNLAAQTAIGLHEHVRRDVPYMAKEQYQAAVIRFFSNPAHLVFGNETADEAYERFNAALQVSVNRAMSKSTVVVTHGTVISLFVARMTGIEPFQLWERLGLPSFVVLAWPDVRLLDVVEQVS